MLRRAAFLVITAFFVTMNVLLWNSEFREQGDGTPVPLAKVWEKILRAPDDSQLEIFHQKKKIGYLRWAANAGEANTTNNIALNDELQEGMVRKIGSYSVDILEGDRKSTRLNSSH